MEQGEPFARLTLPLWQPSPLPRVAIRKAGRHPFSPARPHSKFSALLRFRATADSPAFAGWRLIHSFAPTGTAFLTPAGHLIDGRPRAALGFHRANSAALVALLDMLCLPFLLR